MGLTNFKIKSAAIGKRHHDGRGLCLTLSVRGRGKWTMRYMINRKAIEMGLGRYPELSLADARKKHFEARILIAEGKDPLIERRKAEAQAKREALTRFSDVAESYHDEGCSMPFDEDATIEVCAAQISEKAVQELNKTLSFESLSNRSSGFEFENARKHP